MKTTTFFTLVPAFLGLSLSGAMAQSAVSQAIGFNKVTCAGNADTLISVPFHLSPAFNGLVTGAPTDPDGGTVEPGEDIIIALTGSGFADDELAGSHYVRIRSGAKDGFYYEISGNTATTITLVSNGDDLSGVADADQISVIPHNTLGNLFPGGEGVHASTSGFIRRSEIFLPSTELGINKGAGAVFYYNSTTGQWESFPASGNQDDRVIPPHSVMIVRHNLPEDTTVVFDGRVPSDKHAIQIDIGTAKNDVFFSLDRPVPVSLRDSGLADDGAFANSPSGFIRTDELFVIATGEKNPGAAKLYFRVAPVDGNDSGWRLFPNAITDVGDDVVFEPGEAVIIRKGGAGAPATVFSLNSPTY